MRRESGRFANGSEGSLHGDRICTDIGGRGDGEEVDVVVGFDEVGAGHDLAGDVEGDLRDYVGAIIGIVG